MGKGKARERRQARTREAIIQAAEEIIETRGPDALNMRDVAELIEPVAVARPARKTKVAGGGQGVGDLRPRRARITPAGQ